MNARMEKYNTDNTVKQRTKRNENLYSEVGNMNIDYVDIDVDNALELNPNKNGRASREDFQKQRELNKILPNSREKESDNKIVVEPKEDRVYDINEILKMARENKLFEENEKKRLINTEYNILTKLDVGSLENEEMKKEDLRSLIDDIYEKEMPKKAKKITKYSRSEEAKLLNDLFEDSDDEEDLELQEDLSKAILNKEEKEEEQENDEEMEEEQVVATQIITQNDTMTDTTTMYDFGLEKKSRKDKKNKKTQNMLEGVNLKAAKENDLESDEYQEEPEGKGLVIAIVIVVILILATCAFFVYEYFFGV